MDKRFYIYSITMLFISCTNSPQRAIEKDNIRSINVYKLQYNNAASEFSVTAMVFTGDSLKYFGLDSMLMTYPDLNLMNGRIINDTAAGGLFKSLDTAKLGEIASYDLCDCRAVTKNEYIVRFMYKGSKKDFVLYEKFDCASDSKCLEIQRIREVFLKYE